MPDVPPNSSTTTAKDFFCCMNSFISLCAPIVSGAIGSWRYTLSPVGLFTKHFRRMDITYNIVNVFFIDNDFTDSAFNEAGF